MSGPSNQQIARMLQGMIVDRQRSLIREANYLGVLVGLSPVRAEKEWGEVAGRAGDTSRRGSRACNGTDGAEGVRD